MNYSNQQSHQYMSRWASAGNQQRNRSISLEFGKQETFAKQHTNTTSRAASPLDDILNFNEEPNVLQSMQNQATMPLSQTYCSTTTMNVQLIRKG